MAAKAGFDKDAARAVYTKARNKSKTLLRKSKRLFVMVHTQNDQTHTYYSNTTSFSKFYYILIRHMSKHYNLYNMVPLGTNLIIIRSSDT